MLNPVVIPLPLAVLVIVALAALIAVAQLRQPQAPDPWAGQVWAKPARTGQHRLGTVAEPYRPRSWVEVAVERLNETTDSDVSFEDQEADTRELAAVA